MSLTYADRVTNTKIVSVHFTWALPSGMRLKDEYEATEWFSFSEIDKRYGNDQREKWFHAAYNNGWCGIWVRV